MNEWDRMVMIEQGMQSMADLHERVTAAAVAVRKQTPDTHPGGIGRVHECEPYGLLWKAVREHHLATQGVEPHPSWAPHFAGLDASKVESMTAANWLFSDVHIANAADRIVTLINSKPRSPTKAEIIDAIHGAPVKPISKMECKVCGDTGKILEPPHWPEGLSLQTHTWDQLRAMALPGREFACHSCWRGQMKTLEEKLEPYT